MKKVIVCLLFLISSSFTFAADDFSAFTFLGKMPIMELQNLNKIQFTYSPAKTENPVICFASYFLSSFFIYSTFENDCWNQSQFTKDFFCENIYVN